MEKPAQTEYPVHDLIRRRWSPRAFADKPVEKDKLLSLLEAARWSASCYNEQPWRFMVAVKSEPAEFARMLSCLVEANQAWARLAAVLMISVAKETFTRNDKPNRTAHHDVGLAAAQLTLQATDLGLFVHQMAGIDRDKICATYEIPAGFSPIAGIAIGYPGDPSILPDDYRERELAPRDRKPLAELVYTGAWGKATTLSARPG